MDAVALEAALADVVGRHESLRTIFPEEDGMAFQEILPAEQARPTLLSEVVAEAALASRLAEAAATSMDLSGEIPLRAWLFCLESQRHVLLLVLHHIAGDGWVDGSALAGPGAGLCRPQEPWRGAVFTGPAMQCRLHSVAARAPRRGEQFREEPALLSRLRLLAQGASRETQRELDLPSDSRAPGG